MGPDVVSGFVNGRYRAYINKGKLKDLTGYWNENELDKIFPSYLKKAVTYKERIYFIPVAYQWNPVWYRKDVFDSLNLTKPTTWDEFISVCKSLKKADIQPFTVSGAGWQPPLARWFSTLCLRLHGPEFYESLMSGEVSWKESQVKEVFSYWKNLFEIGALDTAMANNNWSDAVKDLATGNAAMWNIGEWVFEFREIQEISKDLDFFSVPAIHPDLPRTEILHLYGLHVIKKDTTSPNGDLLLDRFCSAETQASNHSSLKYRIPARTDAQGSLNPIQKAIVEELQNVEHFVPLLEFNTHPELARAMLDEFLYFWKNPDDAESVMHNLEELRKKIKGTD
jgi:ABC-type glycerol-3-phosphate transport system substrate-binding protein